MNLCSHDPNLPKPASRGGDTGLDLPETSLTAQATPEFDVLEERNFRYTARVVQCLATHKEGLVTECRERRLKACEPGEDG